MRKSSALGVLVCLCLSTLSFAGAPPANLPPPPTCQGSVQVPRDNRNVASVLVTCSEQMGVSVSAYEMSTGKLLCENSRYYASSSESSACAFPRDKARRLDYKVKIYAVPTGSQMFDDGGTVRKDPTFNFPPQGRLVTAPYIKPAAQKKALGRGTYWDATVKVYVSDADVDPTEGEALIKVELVDVTDGAEKVLSIQMANSDQAVEFNIEHQHVEPLAFGKPHESGDLKMGVNTLKVRVYDAYQNSSRIELPPVAVELQ